MLIGVGTVIINILDFFIKLIELVKFILLFFNVFF